MRSVLYGLIILLAMTGCKKDIDLQEGQKFVHLLEPNQEACTRAQQNSTIYNCAQQIEFGAGRSVTVVLTDIQDIGRYKQRGKKLILEFEQAYDVAGNRMELEIVDKNTLRDENNTIWKRWKGPTLWDLY